MDGSSTAGAARERRRQREKLRGMSSSQVAVTTPARRTPADERMRALLRIRETGRRRTARNAENAFSVSVLVSALRCLLTYVVLPVVGPIVGLAGSVGPVVGLVVGTVSIVAIIASMRRFFRADHRWRWRYTAIGGSIIVFLLVSAVIDIAALVA